MVENVAAKGDAKAAPFADDQPNTRIPSPLWHGPEDPIREPISCLNPARL
jgi:hypothetical protein